MNKSDESKKDKPPPKKGIPRRAFLWTAGIGTGAALLLTGSLLYFTGDKKVRNDTLAKPYKKPFTGKITQEEINALYVQIREGLRQPLEEAKAKGEKLRIVLGEDHESKKSVLLEMLFIRALHELAPESGLVSELTQKEFSEVITPNDKLPAQGIPGKIASSIYAKHTLKVSVLPADHDASVNAIQKLRKEGKIKEAIELFDLTLELRDGKIAEIADQRLKNSGAIIVGLQHVRGVIEKIQGKHPNAPMFAVNVSAEEQLATVPPHRAAYTKQSLEFATRRGGMVNQLKLNGEVDMPLYKMPEMIEKAVRAAPETIKKLSASKQPSL